MTPKKNLTGRNDRGEKQCHKCSAWKPENFFQRNVQARDGYRAQCKACVYGPEGVRAHLRRLAKYGIDAARLALMLADCNETCPICLTRFDECSPPGYTVDHDHTCCGRLRSCGKCVRGLLCRGCNGGLGNLRDDVSNLSRAIEYLRKDRCIA